MYQWSINQRPMDSKGAPAPDLAHFNERHPDKGAAYDQDWDELRLKEAQAKAAGFKFACKIGIPLALLGLLMVVFNSGGITGVFVVLLCFALIAGGMYSLPKLLEYLDRK